MSTEQEEYVIEEPVLVPNSWVVLQGLKSAKHNGILGRTKEKDPGKYIIVVVVVSVVVVVGKHYYH